MIDIAIDLTLRQGEFVLCVKESAAVEVLGLFGRSGSASRLPAR